jgi:hypothetical protein
MSFQQATEEEIEVEVSEEPKEEKATDFEKWIMQCCKAPEWELRKYLRKVLTRAGFEIFEDGYRSDRCDKDKRYETVHNMLAVRGNTPRVCLVAHTDICRDHEELRSDSKYSGSEYAFWMYDRHEIPSDAPKVSRKVEPTLKLVEHEGEIHRIIQDKECRLQVGGDDRLGVAINTYIALNTGFDMGLYFPTDEEIGLKSARVCEMQRLKEFDLLCQVDRGNKSDELVIKISNEMLASYDMACRLLDIAYTINLPRAPVTGMSTDVYALKSKGMCKQAVNMTCGYHQSFGANSTEYIDVNEARNTMKYVAAIIKDFYLEQ